MSDPLASALAQLRAEEERLLACVHCGFCLNACPTYTRLGNEADSPRGRLYLMRAVAEGRLEPESPAFARHLDQCLGCRACEPVCPSGVEYGFLLERARAVTAAAQPPDRLARLLLFTFSRSWATSLAGFGGRVLRFGGMAALLARLTPRGWSTPRFGLAMLAATRPWRGLGRVSGSRGAPAAATQPAGPVQSTAHGQPEAAHDTPAADNYEFADPHARAAEIPQGTALAAPTRAGDARAGSPRVALLRGCVQSALFARVNAATEQVLRANGCIIVPVEGQGCCGALHAHGGQMEGAHTLARRNIAAFDAASVDYIVVNAAGCGAIMKEYGAQFERADDAEKAMRVAKQVRDVAEFLVERGIRPGAALDLRVTYDAPCHLHHAQRITRAPLDMLAAIPGLTHVPLEDAEECCGGAGIYGIRHPDLGGRILEDKLNAIEATDADVVVTPNPGCMMQIGAGLILRRSSVRVLHPLELLAESYSRAGL